MAAEGDGDHAAEVAADGDRDLVAEVAAGGDGGHAAEVAAGGDRDQRVDRLSELPEDILLDIVQRLVMNGDACAAARTCVLSREWGRLPRYEIRNVYLDVGAFFPEDGWRPADPPRKQELYLDRQQHATARFTDALWSFLAAPYRKRVIDTLRLKMILTRFDMVARIGAFIGRAAHTKRVRRVELEIRTELEDLSEEDPPARRKMAVAYGKGFSYLLQCRPSAFRLLTRLSLENMWFRNEDAVNGLLRSSAALEHLSLRFCGFDPETDLVVDAPPESRLRTLLCINCCFLGVVLLRAPSLVEFHCSWRTLDYYDEYYADADEEEYDEQEVHADEEQEVHADEEEEQHNDDDEEHDVQEEVGNFDGDVREEADNFDDDWLAVIPADFVYTPLLKNLTLHYEQRGDQHVVWKLSEFLLLNPGQLEVLTLSFEATKIWVEPEPPKSVMDVLGGLKELHLEGVHPTCDLSWVIFLLEAAPLLEILHVRVFNHACDPKWDKKLLPEPETEPDAAWKPSPEFKHEHLKEVRIRRAFDVAADLPFARQVMKMAVSLERLALGVQDLAGVCEGCAAAGCGRPELAELRRADRDDAAALVERIKDGISTSARVAIDHSP